MAKTVEELKVFQRARDAADAVSALLKSPQLTRDRNLASQRNRASIRIVSDIAEGVEQKTDRHFASYLYNAKGGAAEIRVQMHVAHSRKYVDDGDYARICAAYEEVSRMLHGLIRYLEREDRRGR